MALSRATVAAGIVLLLASGCGDDSGGGDGASASIEATATNFEFDPVDWTVFAGGEFAVAFTNDGGLEHDWTVMREPISSESEFDEGNVLLAVDAAPGGGSTSESFTIDDAGTYQVICSVARHFNDGMEGELTVE
jgi:plastocyanin